MFRDKNGIFGANFVYQRNLALTLVNFANDLLVKGTWGFYNVMADGIYQPYGEFLIDKTFYRALRNVSVSRTMKTFSRIVGHVPPS